MSGMVPEGLSRGSGANSAACGASGSDGTRPGSAASAPLLAADAIQVVKGGRKILDLEHVEVHPGEVLAIIGPNGAGKSTLLSILACLEFPTRGRVEYRGCKVTRGSAISVRRKTAVVFQEPLLLDGTALDNVVIGQKLRGAAGDLRAKAMHWLARFGVEKLAGQMAHTLSGGEAQRVSLARAFALDPELLLMDEPFTSVDVISRPGLIDVFREVRESSGTTTVMVTHDFREVAGLATRALVLSDGRVELDGEPKDVREHPTWRALTDLY